MRGRVSRQHASLPHMSIIMFCINTYDDFKIVFDETTTGKVGAGNSPPTHASSTSHIGTDCERIEMSLSYLCSQTDSLHSIEATTGHVRRVDWKKKKLLVNLCDR